MRENTVLHRGDVVRVRLDPIVGHEQAGIRPALILTPDIINEYGNVITVATITSKHTENIHPYEVLLEPPEGGLKMKSKVLMLQIRSIDKRRVLGKLGEVSRQTMRNVNRALMIATGLIEV